MLEKIINNIEEYIKYSKDNGASRVELSQEVLQQIPILPFDLSDKPKQNATPQKQTTQQPPIAPQQPTYQPAKEHLEQNTTKNTQPEQINISQYSSPEEGLKKIAEMLADCTGCSLGKSKTNFVLGEGSLTPEIMFIGEAPGADEDKEGRPFIGAAGQLLTKMLEKLGLPKEKIYLANILKCRPPNNRKPTEEEITACIQYLEAQIELLKPKVIVTLGGTAVNSLFNESFKITKQRGIWMEYKGIPVMPTYHPAYLLRAQKKRWETWYDMIEVFKKINKPLPEGIK